MRLRQAIVGDNSLVSCMKVPVRRSLTNERHQCERDSLSYVLGDDEGSVAWDGRQRFVS